MRGFWLGLSLSVAFIAGCVSAPVLTGQTSAQPAAQVPSGVIKWDYYCVKSRDINQMIERARVAGRNGWELVTGGVGEAAAGLQPVGIWCFKRPLR